MAASPKVESAPGGFAINVANPGASIYGPLVTRLTKASVGAAAAESTVQDRVIIPFPHRLKSVRVGCASTTAATPSCDVWATIQPPATAVTGALISPAAAGNVEDGAHIYAVSFVTAAGETVLGPQTTVTVADKTVNGKVSLSDIPIGPTGTTSRKVYRTLADATDFKLLTTIADNTTTTYTDNTADGSLGADEAAANTTGATILSANVDLLLATDKVVNVDLATAYAVAPAPIFPAGIIYSLRATTAASTGAITFLDAWLELERVPE